VDVVEIPLAKLRLAEWNANRPSDELVRKLKRSIERFGVVANLVVRRHPTRRGAFEVLSGNHRLELYRELGLESTACVIVDVDDARARLLAVALNRGGSDDPIAYSELIRDVIAGLGDRSELEDLLPETDDSIDAALARLEALPPAVPRDDRYPLLDTMRLGFKLEAALACRRRKLALTAGDSVAELAWWYGHVFARARPLAGARLELADYVDLDDAHTDLELAFAGGERVISIVGTAKRALSSRVSMAAKTAGAELERLALDEHDGLVFGSWRSTTT